MKIITSIIENVKSLTESIIKMDKKLGLKKVTQYTFLALSVVLIINYKSIIKSGIELVAEIRNEVHNEKMQLRDELLTELKPILADFRSNIRAERVLYFEYHNSVENLIGIPFKYVELVQQNSDYGISHVSEERYKSLNVGSIISLYETVKKNNVVVCQGPSDYIFSNNYPDIYETFNSRDGSKRFVFINIPGINTPIGLIVLEWTTESEVELNIKEITEAATHKYIPRINALILSKRYN